jgi:hypothetical protein
MRAALNWRPSAGSTDGMAGLRGKAIHRFIPQDNLCTFSAEWFGDVTGTKDSSLKH